MGPKKPTKQHRETSYGPDGMAAILKRCGLAPNAMQLDQLWLYHQMLREYNADLNLTRIHNFENMVVKLYVDSILPGLMVDLPSPVMDLGTGPGMPGIPLKIFFPHLELLLAESRGRRVAFLQTVVERLGLEGVEIIGRTITSDFERPVAAVITRAVETIGASLERIGGCLVRNGLAIFMKGPRCQEEVEAALEAFDNTYRLRDDRAYQLPHTTHERRLVIFERMDHPAYSVRRRAMERHGVKRIDSEQNETFKLLKTLLATRGIRKEGRAIVSGGKLVDEVLRNFPDRCEAWISSGEKLPPPEFAPGDVRWYQLAPALFRELDLFGSHLPLLLVRVEAPSAWEPAEPLPAGCTVLLPFQDPENVGAAVRSAVAFGAAQIILLSECAHPYHPKALRASGGAVLHASLKRGPSIADLSEDLPLIPLSSEGTDIRSFDFPERFLLLPGIEGPGLPRDWRNRSLSIPISETVESLNAATALAIALYAWKSQSGLERE
ncbi:MAG: 16S rRNA (guanine(527)-N(7))-methyltransferase RsmG [Syntrophobacteraceae bacterium]